jgi:hypothetical protein
MSTKNYPIQRPDSLDKESKTSIGSDLTVPLMVPPGAATRRELLTEMIDILTRAHSSTAAQLFNEHRKRVQRMSRALE